MKRLLAWTFFVLTSVILAVTLMGCSGGRRSLFITRWEVPDSATIYFPLQGNYQFRWHRAGEADYAPWRNAEIGRGEVLSIHLDKAGLYDIEVRPSDSLRFQMVMGDNELVEQMLHYDSLYVVGSNDYLREVRSWGKIRWYSMRLAFAACEGLQIPPCAGRPNLDGCGDCAGMFYRCTALASDLSKWNVENVNLYPDMFSRCPNMEYALQPKFIKY